MVDIISNFNKENIVDFVIAIGIIAVFYLFSPLFSYVIIKIFNIKKKGKDIAQHAFFKPLKTFFRFLGIYIAVNYLKTFLNINDQAMATIGKVFRILVIISISNGLAHNITINSKMIKRYQQRTNRDINDTTIIFAVRIVRFFIYTIATFMILYDLGYDLNGIVTGLGLGSVVITFAAQDTIKNLFGGLAIFLDKPFTVGEYIKFNSYEGTVEDITFRSTKVRTLENSIAQIPNSEISSSTVINYSKIQKRRYTMDLGIVLSTDLHKMMNVEEQIMDLLNHNEYVLSDSANVSFREVRSSDYSIFIYCYLNVVSYVDFLREKEKLNYEIVNILHRNGIELAYNTQTIEIKNA